MSQWTKLFTEKSLVPDCNTLAIARVKSWKLFSLFTQSHGHNIQTISPSASSKIKLVDVIDFQTFTLIYAFKTPAGSTCTYYF